jgi:hypothetical protein
MMIASPSLGPKHCSIEFIRSDPRIRIRSSPSETKEFEDAGIALAARAAAGCVILYIAILANQFRSFAA